MIIRYNLNPFILLTTLCLFSNTPFSSIAEEERDILPVFSEEEIEMEKEKAKELFQKVGELLGFN